MTMNTTNMDMDTMSKNTKKTTKTTKTTRRDGALTPSQVKQAMDTKSDVGGLQAHPAENQAEDEGERSGRFMVMSWKLKRMKIQCLFTPNT